MGMAKSDPRPDFSARHSGNVNPENAEPRPEHGYGIAQPIRQVSEDALKIGDGSLYAALQRLLVDAYVEAP
jgi:hypothetical protein